MRRIWLARSSTVGIAVLAMAVMQPVHAQRRADPVPPRHQTETHQSGEVEAAISESWPEARLPEPREQWRARLSQDSLMRLCSQYRNRPPRRIAAAIEKMARGAIVLPADGVLVGDWRRGEAIAQSGQGQRFTEIGGRGANGGNCYACHQLAPAELSHGTLGPSLTGYGRVHDFSAEAAAKVYRQIYNPHARTACSNMPRFGAGGTLTIEQIKDLVAYLMARDSPVNR